MHRMLDTVTAVLLILGGLNWAIVGWFGQNLVADFITSSTVVVTIYTLMGVAALWHLTAYFGLRDRLGV